VITGPDGSPQELRFGALGTVMLRAFAEVDRLLGADALTRGTRLSLTLNNLFNAREAVRDGTGLTPLAYQAAYRDALGRTIEVEVRRRF
jgi:outer membrane receptor protein involved in Fe transport